jgi:hypothetical protein
MRVRVDGFVGRLRRRNRDGRDRRGRQAARLLHIERDVDEHRARGRRAGAGTLR